MTGQFGFLNIPLPFAKFWVISTERAQVFARQLEPVTGGRAARSGRMPPPGRMLPQPYDRRPTTSKSPVKGNRMLLLSVRILALFLLLSPVAAPAQEWPARQPIKIIVPFTAGSATDV